MIYLAGRDCGLHPTGEPVPVTPVPPALSTPPAPPDPATRPGPDPDRRAALAQAARDFEAGFLAEMLKHAGFGKPRALFGGGAGEEAFASLLVREEARRLADAGGIGLAEHVFRALLAREPEADPVARDA